MDDCWIITTNDSLSDCCKKLVLTVERVNVLTQDNAALRAELEKVRDNLNGPYPPVDVQGIVDASKKAGDALQAIGRVLGGDWDEFEDIPPRVEALRAERDEARRELVNRGFEKLDACKERDALRAELAAERAKVAGLVDALEDIRKQAMSGGFVEGVKMAFAGIAAKARAALAAYKGE